MHKLFKYTKLYSGKAPVFKEGDVFRIAVPLDDHYSFDMGIGSETNRETKETHREDFFKINMAKTLAIITEEPLITQSELKDKLQISLMSVKRLMKALQDNGMIERIGSNRKGYWKITKKDGHSNRIQPQEMLIFPGFLFHV